VTVSRDWLAGAISRRCSTLPVCCATGTAAQKFRLWDFESLFDVCGTIL